jgi:hypothetical protein
VRRTKEAIEYHLFIGKEKENFSKVLLGTEGFVFKQGETGD